MQGHAWRQQAVVERVGRRPDRVVDEGAATLQVSADDGLGDVPRHAERVVTEAAHDRRDEPLSRALDEEVVVALEAVDLDRFDTGEPDVEPGPEHALVRDDEVVVQLRAQHHHLVEARSAVDVHRRVDVVLDRVLALAGDGLRLALRRDAEAAHQRERADDECVVAGVAFQAQLGLVAVDGDLVVAGSAIHGQRERGAAAQPPTRRLDREELVARPHAGRRRGDPR